MKPAPTRWPRSLPAALALGAGVMLTVVLTLLVRRWEAERATMAVRQRASALTAALAGAMEQQFELLRTVAALTAPAEEHPPWPADMPMAHAVRDLVRQAAARRPGPVLVTWLPRVPADERSGGDVTVRVGASDVQVREVRDGVPVPAGRRAEHFPLLALASADNSLVLSGLDLSADEPVRLALERARDAAAPVAVPLDPSLQPFVGGADLLVVLPVYRTTSPPTAAARRAELLGFLAAGLRARDLVRATLRTAGIDGVAVQVVTTRPDGTGTLLASYDPRRPDGPPQDWHAPPRWQAALPVADQTWLLRVYSQPDALPTARAWLPWAVLATGLLVSSLLAGYVLAAARYAGRVERQVAERTAELAAANAALEREVVERRLLEQELIRQARSDPLTGLPNRAAFIERLAAVVRAPVRPGEVVAVCFLDLDGFKLVNDNLGHRAGDALLVAVAQRLRANVRPVDLVARFGGDEFTVLLTGLRSPQQALAASQRLIEALHAPVTVEGRELFLNASAGVAVRALPAPDVTPDDLLREADVALYAAKAAGKGQAVLYDPCMGRGAGERLELETDLRRALQRGELLLHFQPQMDLASGEVLAVEALLRWRHPRRGLVPPAEFIPLAEETGLILPIGRWVLEEACRQARAWQDLRPSAAPLVVGVNLSPRQFVQPDLVDQVRRALSAADLPAHCLELELTESAVMQDGATALAALQSLKALGVRLAIDDFGTGYSSLDYLRRFPVDTLKVDRTFVQELDHSRRTVAIVEAVTRLAHAVGMEVVAEGVETSSQLLHASAVHCDRGQGYYFARPLPAAELEAFLRSIGRRPAAHAS